MCFRVRLCHLLGTLRFDAIAKKAAYVRIAMDEQTLDHVKAQKAAGTGDENFHAYTPGYTCSKILSIILETRSISLYGIGGG